MAAPPVPRNHPDWRPDTDGGSSQSAFTNTSGAFFGVLATMNPALPLSNWTTLGDATEVSPGQFQLTDPPATNAPQIAYRVCSP